MNLSAKDKRKMEYHKLCVWYLMRASEIRNELAFAAKDAYVHANKKTAIAFLDAGDYVDEVMGLRLQPVIKQLRKGKYILSFSDNL